MTSHKPINREVRIGEKVVAAGVDCSVCGAIKFGATWQHPGSSLQVSVDCDKAREQIYPRSGTKLENDTNVGAERASLTLAQVERFYLLLESLGSATRATARTLLSCDPDSRGDLERALGDIVVALEMIFKAKDLNEDIFREHIVSRQATVKNRLLHQE